MKWRIEFTLPEQGDDSWRELGLKPSEVIGHRFQCALERGFPWTRGLEVTHVELVGTSATDPNEILRNLRRWAEQATKTSDPDILADLAPDMADAFEALDGWLSDGGRFPCAWQPARESAVGIARAGR